MRIVFFGTPSFAVSSLERTLQSRHGVAAIVTQPDRPKGRFPSIPQPTSVHALASSKGIPVLQPDKPNEPAFLRRLRTFGANCGIVVAYGAILPKSLLDLFPQGVVNLHASLLPKLRGAAPIQWALIRGEEKTGVTIFQLDEQLDHGPILLQVECPIEPQDDAVSLSSKLAQLGAGALEEALTRLEDGTARGTPQDDAQATCAPRLKKEDGILDWSKDCRSLHNLVRGVQPWPGAMTWWGTTRLKVIATRPDPQRHELAASAGAVVEADPRMGLCVQTGQGGLRILCLQPAGGKVMEAAEFLRGHPIPAGTLLSSSPTPS